jgi:hypothetical protein
MVDETSSNDITSRLDKTQARKFLAEFFNNNPNNVSFTKHAQEQMQKRDLMSGDILNVLRAGIIHNDPELENGSWRYHIQTKKITVVFAFNGPDKIRIITAWRNI